MDEEEKFMKICPSQSYKIKKIKERKVTVILAGIQREFPEATIARKIIAFRLNKDFNSYFGIQNISQIEEAKYEQCISFIKAYIFKYNKHDFGAML
jgi:hypothetical protein